MAAESCRARREPRLDARALKNYRPLHERWNFPALGGYHAPELVAKLSSRFHSARYML